MFTKVHKKKRAYKLFRNKISDFSAWKEAAGADLLAAGLVSPSAHTHVTIRV